MKTITSKAKAQIAKALLTRIKELHKKGETVRFMEVCGTHTVAIFREGLRQVLPRGIELISGPGCPVCVTDQEYIDKALAYAKRDDVVIVTFGDMLKVPGTKGSLQEARGQGAQIEIIYSPIELLSLSERYPDKKIVFLAIGFETTIAVIAATIETVHQQGKENILFLISHKLVPPVLKVLLDNPQTQIDGFILPGHVSVIIGEEPYRFLTTEYQLPACIAGFDGLDILAAIVNLLEQRQSGEPTIGNAYKSMVAPQGNPVAQKLMQKLYKKSDDSWRGMGRLANSGLSLRDEYARYDAEVALPLQEEVETIPPDGCCCGQVLQGLMRPDQCRLFGTTCTSDHPVGACMVSVEGSCATWYKYGRSSSGLRWDEDM